MTPLHKTLEKKPLTGSQKLQAALFHRACLHGIGMRIAMAFGMRDVARKHLEVQSYFLKLLDRLLTKAGAEMGWSKK